MRNDYRGLTKETNRWAHGSYAEVQGRHFIILDDAEIKPIDPDMGGWGDGISGFVEVLPESVCQSTGKKDKNGVEIYGGDRVQDKNGHIWHGRVLEVAFDIEMGRWSLNDYNTSGTPLKYIGSPFTKTEADHIEVIGNIHSNPELEAKDGA